MKACILITFFLFQVFNSYGQIAPLTAEPDGGNKKASVSEQIGIVRIVINYNRPGVKGREGKIWNTPVAHYGFADQGHGTSYSTPWRAGANENTTISFSHPVTIEGKELAAGVYGFFIALGESESMLIFSRVNNSWGSFYYDSTQDALRVKVKNESLDQNVEWLRYDFNDQADNSATIAMSWEKRKIPFRVQAEIQTLQMASFRSELRTTRPFYDFIQAANYCVTNNIELEQALSWMDRAIYFRVMGVKNFQTLSTKAAVLSKMNKMEEAGKIMEEAIPFGTVAEVHQYGRTLLNMGKTEEALKVFQKNYEKFPNVFTTNVGMGRGYSAKGDYKTAIDYLKIALSQAPNAYNKESVAGMIKKLELGKDANK
jgi:tetratricopeptide (TPR) repeat protein